MRVRHRKHYWMVTFASSFAFVPMALASSAGSSATAGYDNRTRGGVAEATAEYDGRIGWARTNTETNRRGSNAQGVAVGVDNDGVSLSVSNAHATNRGPALASTFNLSIGRDGDVSTSFGLTTANGPIAREASAGGETATRRSGGTAVAYADGATDRFGRVDSFTHAEQTPARSIRGVREMRREFRESSQFDVRNNGRFGERQLSRHSRGRF
ncbi:MAG: hypothetical protein AB7N71_07450 [Phycisphaerae bacterium]